MLSALNKQGLLALRKLLSGLDAPTHLSQMNDSLADLCQTQWHAAEVIQLFDGQMCLSRDAS